MTLAENKARIAVQLLCPCCGQSKMDPKVIPAILKIEKKLGIFLQINSGYRCPAHNAQLLVDWIEEAIAFEKAHPDEKFQKPKPSKLSRHRLGLAIDVQCHKSRQAELIAEARAAGFNGIGRGLRMVHLDFRPEPAEWVY